MQAVNIGCDRSDRQLFPNAEGRTASAPFSLPLLIAAIALAGRNALPCFLLSVLSKRATQIIRFLELSARATAHEPLVALRRDQLSLAAALSSAAFGSAALPPAALAAATRTAATLSPATALPRALFRSHCRRPLRLRPLSATSVLATHHYIDSVVVRVSAA
jgi:hypothetical protein